MWRYLENRGTAERSVGLLGQAFCSALRDELTGYYRLVAVLEAQLSAHSPSTWAPSATSLAEHASEFGLTLRRLAVWSQDPMERMQVRCFAVWQAPPCIRGLIPRLFMITVAFSSTDYGLCTVRSLLVLRSSDHSSASRFTCSLNPLAPLSLS